ncbi:MAG: C-terminal binding protein [Armatimonadetes bacterium]|nr:C-terminal binding protein [Armatimonadota bacterium]
MTVTPKWRCFRTELYNFPMYDISLERSVLEPHGIQVESVDMDAPDAFDRVAPEADAILHLRGVLAAEHIAKLTRCRIISHYGTGVDRLDVAAATARGIWVTNGPLYAVDEVSSHAIALLLVVARKIIIDDRAVREGRWHIPPVIPLHRIAGKTLGMLGLGNISRATARKGRALGLTVIAYDPYLDASVFEREGVRAVDFATCMAEADFLSVHLPLTDETRRMIDREALARMKPGAILINTSRGGVIDEDALVEALRGGRLAGAGLDVFAQEPVPTDHPLLQLPNVVVTGHIGFYSEESREQMRRDGAEQVVMALQGKVPAFLYNRELLAAR